MRAGAENVIKSKRQNVNLSIYFYNVAWHATPCTPCHTLNDVTAAVIFASILTLSLSPILAQHFGLTINGLFSSISSSFILFACVCVCVYVFIVRCFPYHTTTTNLLQIIFVLFISMVWRLPSLFVCQRWWWCCL